MTKYKPISRRELLRRILRRLPELNPEYVSSELERLSKSPYDVTEVISWIRYFENQMEFKEYEITETDSDLGRW